MATIFYKTFANSCFWRCLHSSYMFQFCCEDFNHMKRPFRNEFCLNEVTNSKKEVINDDATLKKNISSSDRLIYLSMINRRWLDVTKLINEKSRTVSSKNNILTW